jgi:hypothetical protein
VVDVSTSVLTTWLYAVAALVGLLVGGTAERCAAGLLVGYLAVRLLVRSHQRSPSPPQPMPAVAPAPARP